MRIITIIVQFAASVSAVFAQTPQGSIVGWGSQVVGVELTHGFVQVAAGWDHSLGLKADGSIVAWGDNSYGQANVPSPNTGFLAIAAGRSHSLGLKTDGSIVAWGAGRTNTGSWPHFGQSIVPAPNMGFVGIAAGEVHSLGLKADGSIVGWGYNGYGQTNVPAPNTGFVAIAAGGGFFQSGHSLGLKANGSIVAWGDNYYGQANVPGPNTSFVAIAAGADHSLALKADGSIVTWGRNDFGQRNVPAPNTGFLAIAAGVSHSVGLKADCSIVAWGSSFAGQAMVPQPNTGFTSVAAGFAHSLGLKTDGSVVAWGQNRWGQTNGPASNTGFVSVVRPGLGLKADGAIVTWGDNYYGQLNVPSPNAGFVAVAAGHSHALGLKADGTIHGWGCNYDNYGQCSVPAPNTGFVAVAAGSAHSLGLKADGSIVGWGRNYERQTNVPAPNSGFVAVAAGSAHSLGLSGDGAVVAWGCGGLFTNTAPCIVPLPNTGFVAIAASGSHSLGLKSDGSLVAWGVCAGSGGDSQCQVPFPNTGFTAVAAGNRHSLALKEDGSIVAWGCDNPDNRGQCDIPEPNTGFVAIAGGRYHSLGIRGSVGAPVPGRVWAGAQYDVDARMLSVSAKATDPNSGANVTSGTASFSIPTLSRWGPLVYGADRWEAVVDFSGDPPGPGTYMVNVNIAGGLGQATFPVPGASGVIRGIVYDAASQPFENVTVSLHDSPTSLDVSLMETQSDADGRYELAEVPPGWYVVAARAEGYLVQDRNVRVPGGQVVEQDFSLTSTRTLRQLSARMDALYAGIRGAMDYEAARVSEMTAQAAGHFNAQIDAWDVAGFFTSVLADLIPSNAALTWITNHATRETAKGVLIALVKDAATTEAGWLYFFNRADEIAEQSTRLLLPEGMDQWRGYSVAELKAQAESYQSGRDALETAHAEFVSTSNVVVVPADFDFARAQSMISRLALQAERIGEGQLVVDLVPALVDPPFMYAEFPSGHRFWLANDDWLRKVSGAKKVTTTVKAASSALAVGATVSVVGSGVGVIAGMVAQVAGGGGLFLDALEVPLRWEGVKAYVLALKKWNNDMFTFPKLYVSTSEFLQEEAAKVTYLTSDRSRYASTAMLDMRADGLSDNVPLIYTDNLASSVVSREAEVAVTNTGTAPARIRAVAVSFTQFGDGRPVATGSGYLDLGPGDSGTIRIPYVGISRWYDPWSPHVLRAEVYVGPFLAKAFYQPYRVRRGLFATTAGGEGANAPFTLTYLRDGEGRQIAGDGEEPFELVMTQLADTALTPVAPLFETVYGPGDLPAVEFRMQSDAHGVVELRVCDNSGHCVGYDSARDGVLAEFPAQYSGNGSAQQSVYIPSPGADPYTVRAVLTGALSGEQVNVTLWTLETPVRPAMMAVSPAAWTTRLYWDETATMPLSVAEAGGQVPLSNVSVTVGELVGGDGASLLSVLSGRQRSFARIAAGTVEDAEVRVQAPRGVAFGSYGGTVSVESGNGGAQNVVILVIVLPMGDFDANGRVELADFAPLVRCLSGPVGGSVSLECRVGDFDGDEDIDLRDFAQWQNAFTAE